MIALFGRSCSRCSGSNGDTKFSFVPRRAAKCPPSAKLNIMSPPIIGFTVGKQE